MKGVRSEEMGKWERKSCQAAHRKHTLKFWGIEIFFTNVRANLNTGKLELLVYRREGGREGREGGRERGRERGGGRDQSRWVYLTEFTCLHAARHLLHG